MPSGDHGADWSGIFPAATTQLTADELLALEATAAHFRLLVEAGVDGLVVLGTLGEGAALEPAEKRDLLACAVEAVAGRVPLLVGVAETATRSACRLAEDAKALGADGLMVLPGLVYPADGVEAVAHVRAVAQATDLPIMVYNNPVAYGVDLTADAFADLADEPTLVAVKESSDDPRRLTDIINATGERYRLFCGVDDLALESALLGCHGWVAGLVNAFPTESIQLWRLASEGRWDEARDLYRWFMPLLHLDTELKLVQAVKFAQALAGYGSETVRLPRQKLSGAERARVAAVVEAALADRPDLAAA